ncbi:MAG: hypothetical protein PVJ05_02185 [Candidatus Thorarchaeota archaeon]|jgi:hypothetical membrane protein
MNEKWFHDLTEIKRFVVLFGVFQFFLLTFTAAFFYPGGYDYFNYYFSDLGAVLARNNQTNIISATLFFLALTIVSITLVPFWLDSLKFFTHSKAERFLGQLGSGMGFLCSPLLIGVALFPLDTQLETHFGLVITHFAFFSFAILLYSIAFLFRRRYPLTVLGLSILAIGMFLMINPMSPFAAFLQKVVVYSYFIWVGTLTCSRAIENET